MKVIKVRGLFNSKVLGRKLFALSKNFNRNKDKWSSAGDSIIRWNNRNIVKNPNSNNNYDKYLPVWSNPDTGEPINKFSIISTDKFNEDYKFHGLNSINKARVDELVQDISNPSNPLVFYDNDSQISSKYYTGDEIHKGWDTMIHILHKLSKKNEYITYSKFINNEDRFNYKVYKPKLIDGEWVSKVELVSCKDHNVGEEIYDGRNYKRTLANSLGGNSYNALLNYGLSLEQNSKEFSDNSEFITFIRINKRDWNN